MSKAPAQRPSAICLLIDGFELPAAKRFPLSAVRSTERNRADGSMRFLIFVFIMLMSSPSIAQGIYIEGTMDCGEWVQSRERQRSIAYETYLVGLINGLALGRKVEFWNAKGIVMSREQAYLWMDNYCKSNPLSQPTAGVFQLFEERLQ